MKITGEKRKLTLVTRFETGSTFHRILCPEKEKDNLITPGTAGSES